MKSPGICPCSGDFANCRHSESYPETGFEEVSRIGTDKSACKNPSHKAD